MDSHKRRRADDGDRLSELPDCLLLDILSRVGSRLAVQTSALSRRWRHLWRDVPCADVDERDFSSSSGSGGGGFFVSLADSGFSPQQGCSRFEDFADHVLPPSQSPSPSPSPLCPHRRLDAFRLHISSRCTYATTDRWVRRGLARSPAAVTIRGPGGSDSAVRWISPSPSSLARLTKLRLVGVTVPPGCFVSSGHVVLGCPALEDLHMERCYVHGFHAISSPILRRLAVVSLWPYCCHVAAADLPRLAYLRLVLLCRGDHAPAPEENQAPLPSVAEASIRLTELDYEYHRNKRERKKNKLDFLKTMCGLLARFPNVVSLDLSSFTTTALLEEESQEFPLLDHLRTLRLDDCELGVNFHALTSVLRNTPKLETLRLHRCKFLGSTPRRTPSKRRGSTTMTLQCKNLKLIEIKSRQDDEPQILRLLTEVSKGMPMAQWRRVDRVSNVAGLVTVQLHRTEKGTKLV